jgi:hypothetical protein
MSIKIKEFLLNSLKMSFFLLIFVQPSFAQVTTIEDELFNIKIGSSVEELNKRYTGLYKHHFGGGEVLHEACNQQNLEVFTFGEDPWSLGHITYISVKKENDVSVCRDSQGALPDFDINPVTSKGVGIGSNEKEILEQYGQPTDTKEIDSKKLLRYKFNKSKEGMLISEGMLVFTLENNQVISFSLAGIIPGAIDPKKVFDI